MVLLVRITECDDKYATRDIEVMVCSSVPCAREIILNEVNKGFEDNFKSLEDAADALSKELYLCNYSDDKKTFVWSDDCKGETYIICRVNQFSGVNTTFQNIGSIELG